MQLYWESPFDPEQLVDSYAVTYQLINTTQPVAAPRPPVTVGDVMATSLNIENLLGSSVYRVLIYAVTGYGTSPASSEIFVHTRQPCE